MKLAYFSYDFSACCCEAVKDVFCVGCPAGRAARCARGRRPAREPSAPRAFGSARRLEARPGPATAHGHRSLAPTGTPSLAHSPHAQPLTSLIPEPTRNFACNSSDTTSNLQFRSLELQRFQTLLKLLPIELHTTFLEGRPRHYQRAPQPPHSTRQPPRLKPMTPMRVDHCPEMKPPTPLRSPCRTRLKPLTPLLAQNSQFQPIFRPQRCHGFHAPLAEYPQRRRRFHQTSNQGY